MKYSTKQKIKDFFGKIAEKLLLEDKYSSEDNYLAYFFFVFVMLISFVISSNLIFRENGIGIVFSVIFSFAIASGVQYLIIKLEKWLNDWKY